MTAEPRAATKALLLLTLLQAPAEPPSAAARDELLALLAEPSPVERRTKLRALLARRKLDLAQWEGLVRALPEPPLPLAGAKPGQVTMHEVPLWTGAKTGVVTTRVWLALPALLEPGQRYPLLVASHGSGGEARLEIAQWRRVAGQVPLIVAGADEQFENQGYRSSPAERLTPLGVRRWARTCLPVDSDRVFLAGTSRGGHIAWDVAARYPDAWAGVASLIGGPRLNPVGGENNLRLVRNLLDLPLVDLQGEQDDPGLLFNLRHAFAILEQDGARDARFLTFPDLGHSYRLDAVDWADFFATRRRDPFPPRVRLWCTRPEEGRRAWLAVTKVGKDVQDAFRPTVEEGVWNKLDDDGKKRWVAQAAEKRTASIDARLSGSDETRTLTLTAKSGVGELRLLLPRALWPSAKTQVELATAAGKPRRLTPQPSAETFLLDWLENVDARRAPVAAVTLTP